MRVAISTLIVLLFVMQAVADDATDDDEAILGFTYVVKAAPVWTDDGKFDPSVLINLIETTTVFGDRPATKSMHIHQIPKTGALYISTTISAHDQIWKLLKQFPSIAASWGPGALTITHCLESKDCRIVAAHSLRMLRPQSGSTFIG